MILILSNKLSKGRLAFILMLLSVFIFGCNTSFASGVDADSAPQQLDSVNESAKVVTPQLNSIKMHNYKTTESPSSWALLAGNLTKVLLALFFVLLLAYLAYYLTTKLKIGGISNGDIKLIQSYPLGTKEKLLIVKVQKEYLLLGVTANQINLIKQLDYIAPEISKEVSEKVKFNDILHKFSFNKDDKEN